MATPSAHATSSTATALSAAPPTASTARTGCQVIRSRIRAPANCSTRLPERGAQDHDEEGAERDQDRRLGVAERGRGQPDAEAGRRAAAPSWRRRR